MNTSTFDIIIVGDGIVGSSLALSLAQQTRLSIAVLEHKIHDLTWSHDRYHHRVSAIAPHAKAFFQRMHVWEDMLNMRVSPFTKMHVWDGVGHGEISFASKDIKADVLGYIIENNVLHFALKQKRQSYSYVVDMAPITLSSLNVHEDYVELRSKESIFRAKLVIGTDGPHSWLRTQANIHVQKKDYLQTAIVANVETERPHLQTAAQVFLPQGPLAFLPLVSEKHSSIVWSLPQAEADRLMQIDAAQFKQELAQAFAFKLGAVTEIEKRYCFPLYQQEAHQYIKPRIALAGDAAHVIHPLAGQGVNMGLADAANLSAMIVDAYQHKRDYSHYHHLRRYERSRRSEHFLMMKGVAALERLFASDKKTLQTLRSAGLNAVHNIPFIKRIFMQHAMGG